MEIRFRAIHEPHAGEQWQRVFDDYWPAYRDWFLRDGDGGRPGFVTCRARLREHLPELVPLWEHLVELAGGGDRQARMLSLYCPTPYMSGCSQVVCDDPDRGPVLARNYDYRPDSCDGVLLRSRWHDTEVIASSDCMWGVLDGINEHGLVVSLAFGGSRRVGDGFGIPLILRYILEFCRSVDEGTAVLCRVPSSMAYNVTLADASGGRATVQIAPGVPARTKTHPYATNHQDEVEWEAHAVATCTREREQRLHELLGERGRTHLAAEFQQEPLFQTSYSKGFGTLYTALYTAREGRVTFYWPGRTWSLGFDDFPEGEMAVRYRDG